MDDRPEDELLEAAFEKVLQHSAFHRYTREQLQSCESFCEIIRQAEHADVIELRDELEEIAFNTDDHNEATGFLNVFAALGGGFETSPVAEEGVNLLDGGLFSELEQAREEFADIPVQDLARFTDWITGISADRRSLAVQAARDALLRHGVRIANTDRDAGLRQHQAAMLLYYVLDDFELHLEFANFAVENLDSSYDIRSQIPARLWEAFNSRPRQEVERLIEKWWGSKSAIPNDFFIALEWQRAGYIKIHRGRGYHETVAEFLLDSCEPDPDGEFAPSGHGIEAIRLDPFLERDLYAALREQRSYPWLISPEIPLRARYLDELFSANALDRGKVLSALDHGIAKNWDAENLPLYQELRERLAG